MSRVLNYSRPIPTGSVTLLPRIVGIGLITFLSDLSFFLFLLFWSLKFTYLNCGYSSIMEASFIRYHCSTVWYSGNAFCFTSQLILGALQEILDHSHDHVY